MPRKNPSTSKNIPLHRKESMDWRCIPRSAGADIFIQQWQDVVVLDNVERCVSHLIDTNTCELGKILTRLNLKNLRQKSIKMK